MKIFKLPHSTGVTISTRYHQCRKHDVNKWLGLWRNTITPTQPVPIPPPLRSAPLPPTSPPPPIAAPDRSRPSKDTPGREMTSTRLPGTIGTPTGRRQRHVIGASRPRHRFLAQTWLIVRPVRSGRPLQRPDSPASVRHGQGGMLRHLPHHTGQARSALRLVCGRGWCWELLTTCLRSPAECKCDKGKADSVYICTYIVQSSAMSVCSKMWHHQFLGRGTCQEGQGDGRC